MTLLDAIKSADELRPNAISDETKAKWVMELDGEIAEMMGVDAQKNPFPKNIELLMPYPKDHIYGLHLMAKIDAANEESQLYANDSTMANSEIISAKAWWMRTLSNPKGSYVRL